MRPASANAVIHITRNKQHKIKDDDVDVVATVGLGPNGAGGFVLTAALDVTLAGVDQPTAEAIVADAHKTCPIRMRRAAMSTSR